MEPKMPMKSPDAPVTRVIFFQVRDTASKFKVLTATASAHFEKKEPFLIVVEDEKAQVFVDELLWKMPPTGFLPHAMRDMPGKEWVAITKTKSNVNEAKVAFNLCPTPLLIEGPFRIIYEFEDLTTQSKNKLSSIRFDAYKNAQFIIEAKS